MSKGGKHPELYDLVIVQPDGKKIKVRSTNRNGGEDLVCDLGPSNHPAWQKGKARDAGYLDSVATVASFRKKYGSHIGGRLRSKNASK